MATSSICTHFTQNAWKKDLCSNCFKSKDEHKQTVGVMSSATVKYNPTATSRCTSSLSNMTANNLLNKSVKCDYPNKNKTPSKSIIRKTKLPTLKTRSNKVSFPKHLSEVIGYGGERSDDSDDDNDFMNLANDGEDDDKILSSDDEESLELKRITRANTDFNMHNGNFLGDPKENIKKTFAALKLGAPQVDKEGKKQTLQINVTPFGSNSGSKQSSTTVVAKAKYEAKSSDAEKICCGASTNPKPVSASPSLTSKSATNCTNSSSSLNSNVKHSLSSSSSSSNRSDSDSGTNSPPIERAMEKSLLDEISETLEQKQNALQQNSSSSKTVNPSPTSPRLTTVPTKIKFEITSLSESIDNKTFLDLKKPIVRNTPITKAQLKPKVNIFTKYSDTESVCSDHENSASAYYDVVESQISYENLPDGKYAAKGDSVKMTCKAKEKKEPPNPIYTTSQYITDTLLSSKTRAASYNLHEGNFMTSKIMSDGLIVTKCSSDDALDSTGSSFDGSSDEETSYNMIRSESDSGIGISLSNDCKALSTVNDSKREREKPRERLVRETATKLQSKKNNNCDYEDIKVLDHKPVAAIKEDDITEKSRELHGEPDGSADPDGSLERIQEEDPLNLPALPKSPPPTKVIDARPSFLHGVPKPTSSISLKKPDLPAKPLVTTPQAPLKTFMAKRPERQQQVITQLQMVISKSNENLNDVDALKDDLKLKKGKAPNPPLDNDNNKMENSVEEKISEDENKHVQVKEESTKMPHVDTKECSSPQTASASINSYYARKLPTIVNPILSSSNCGTVSKAMAAQVLKEKNKTERNQSINPKFRSLNTFATQRNNAIRNVELQNVAPTANVRKPLPELISKNPKILSMSEECLAESVATTPTTALIGNSMSTTNLPAAIVNGDKKSPIKTKTKFSIKKFLRMGTNKATDTLSNKYHKESIYSEICTGDDANVSGKPRLVIIHPLDINTTAVEVVKDITKTNDTVVTQTVAVCTAAKPPAPPLRSTDGQRAQEINKPARPPPPKSAELRRKQQIASTINSDATMLSTKNDAFTSTSPPTTTAYDTLTTGSIKNKSDNVYANLGEIRSSIAPRKPERTASMREREAQLELVRKRHIEDNYDTISIGSSSNGENVFAMEQNYTNKSTNKFNNLSKNSPQIGTNKKIIDGKPPSGSSNRTPSTYERKKFEAKINLSNKLEIFDNNTSPSVLGKSNLPSNVMVDGGSRGSSLKDSVRKITSTIDNYLKDKRDHENLYECVKDPASPTSCRSTDLRVHQQLQQQPPLPQHLKQTNKRTNIYVDTLSLASYTRSEYGPVRPFGLNNSLANIPRLTSASYCGSETGDIDIYSPYSYYGSESGGDITADINDTVWGIPAAVKNRSKAVNRLRMRKGRSVVHKTIEDNYSAVVGANHEALAQVLEQLQQTPLVPLALRPLANAINLRFEDFSILEGGQAFVVGKKAFHGAIWTSTPVTLALSADCNQLAGVGGELNQLSGGISGALNPITEFCDLVPSYHLPLMPSTEMSLLQATISVLPRLQLDTLQSIGSILKGKSQVLDNSNYNFRGSIPNLTVLKDKNATLMRNGVSVQNLSTLSEEMPDTLSGELDGDDCNNSPTTTNGSPPAFDDVMTREVAFIMLQLINGMKNLQMKGVEDMPLSLSNVVLSKEVDNKDAQARLCVLQGSNNHDEDEPMGTLCKCAYIALTELLPTTKITTIVGDILLQERSESLSKSKSVLEFILWGPSDVVLAGTTRERELALQRWLDLERATVLHGLVRTRVELTVYDECHLMFLVRSTAKIMNDAAKILEQQSTANANL